VHSSRASHPDTPVTTSGSLDHALGLELAALEQKGLRRVLRPLSNRRGARVREGDRVLVDFSSNDYLGLASHPEVAEAAARALVEAGTGAAAARLIAGHHELHAKLEQRLAQFLGTERALLFPAGYMANVGAIPSLVDRNDGIYSDVLNHASLIDGCRLSRAEVHRIPHGDPAALEQALARTGERYRRRLVVVEGLYSMDGDLYPLDALVRLAERYDAWVYLDDAHAVGVLGPNGRGTVEHWGVQADIPILVGTLGKAFGTAGAFVAGSATLIDFLTNRARAFVYTTGTPPALAAATLAALEVLVREPERRARVRANARALRTGLAALGRSVPGPSDGHIVPLVLGSSEAVMAAGSALRDAGFLVGAVRPPTVPAGRGRLRITLSAAHTGEDIEALLDSLRRNLPG